MHSGLTRSLGLLGVALLLAVFAGGVAPGAAAAARAVSAHPAASFAISGSLHGVTATSARSAWGVGDSGTGAGIKTLILHWNGSTWRRVPSPAIGSGGALRAVATVSADRAWAVGCIGCLTGAVSKTLIEHWNGKAWKRVPSPSPGTFAAAGRSATSAAGAAPGEA